MACYSLYVDGFNMYYAIKDKWPQYKWLNYRALAESVVGPGNSVESVVYFTAHVTWRPDSHARHMEYIKALRWAGVETVVGRFAMKQTRCHACHQTYWTHEEKRTDVNIAVRVVADAVADVFDRAILLSADSDMLPVVETVHRLAPDKEVGVMFPLGRDCLDLRRNADFRRKMKEKMLDSSLFPDEIVLGDGRKITKPSTWA